MDNWEVCSQLGRRSNATQAQGLCEALENCEKSHTEGPAQGQLVPVARKRPEWKCEPPTTTDVARGLNDLADKAAGEALTTIKQEVQEKEERINEEGAWAKRALQTVAKMYSEYTDHVGFVPVFHKNAIMRWVA